MTHYIIVTGVNRDKPFKANAMKWSSSFENFSDSASFKVPGKARVEKNYVQTGLLFKEGMKVTIAAGYDGDNDIRFKGFIKRVNFSIPLEIECEGYSYQLRKLNFTKSYKNTTVKKILTDLVAGTDIVLSNQIPEIPLEKAMFPNVTGIQVLEWLQENCLLTVHFNFETLYCGLEQVVPSETKKFRLNWNVIKDTELKFNDKKEFADVRFEVTARKKNGERERGFSGKDYGQVKRYTSEIKDPVLLARIAKQVKSNLVNRGYEGSITTFLKPFVRPGMSVSIEDAKYLARTGKYFVSGVDGEFSSSGGRQKIKIANSL